MANSDSTMQDNPLSEREMDVARSLATGASNVEIARELIISPHTVKVHLRNIFEKLNVNSRTEASMLLVQRGWIDVPGIEAAPPPDQTPPEPEPLSDQVARPSPWQRVYLVVVLIVSVLALWVPTIVGRQQASPDLLTDAGNISLGRPEADIQPRWEVQAPMGQARSRLAVAVDDGLIYVIGGETANGQVVDTVSTYDLRFNQWYTVAPLPEPAANAAAATYDGKIYVAGGTTAFQLEGEPEIVDGFWVYEPQSDRWQSAGTLPTPLAGAALVAHESGLYLLGGWDGQTVSDEVWRLDTNEENGATWIPVTNMDAPRAFFGAAAVGDELYVAGGYDGENELDLAAVYNLKDDTWRELPPLSTPRGGLSLVYDGLALFALGGGWTQSVDTLERYDPATNVWSNFPAPLQGEWRHMAAAGSADHLHLIGGWSGEYLDTHLQYQSSFRALLPVITLD